MKLMYSFACPDSGDATIPEINGRLTEIIRISRDVPETVEVTADNQGILIKFHDTGTGLCSDVIYHPGDLLTMAVQTETHPGVDQLNATVRLEILWSRTQDDENILAMCVRQLIFDTYEELNLKIDPELLGLLHNKSTNSTQRLVEIYGLEEELNKPELKELVKNYRLVHPSTHYRYGAKILHSHLRSWSIVLGYVAKFLSPEHMLSLHRPTAARRPV
jgi:hypothetical protein